MIDPELRLRTVRTAGEFSYCCVKGGKRGRRALVP